MTDLLGIIVEYKNRYNVYFQYATLQKQNIKYQRHIHANFLQGVKLVYIKMIARTSQ